MFGRHVQKNCKVKQIIYGMINFYFELLETFPIAKNNCVKLLMENFHIEAEFLGSIFKCNNYPVNLIDQCIKKFLEKLYVPKQIVPTVPKRELLVFLPFLGKFSLNLRKNLYKSVTNHYHNAV